MKERVAILVSALLLGGAAVERWSLSAPASAAEYHARVRSAGESAPLAFDGWSGRDVPLPPAAVKMLRPNVVLSREFERLAATRPAEGASPPAAEALMATGRRASFLLIQCDDTRELVAHYPPMCYPGQGYSVMAARPKTTRFDDLDVEWTQYEFVQQSVDRFASLVVAHFIVMPDGTICRSMDAMRTSAARVSDRFYGAAQVQVVTSGQVPEAEREAIFADLVRGHLPLIRQIRAGVVR